MSFIRNKKYFFSDKFGTIFVVEFIIRNIYNWKLEIRN